MLRIQIFKCKVRTGVKTKRYVIALTASWQGLLISNGQHEVLQTKALSLDTNVDGWFGWQPGSSIISILGSISITISNFSTSASVTLVIVVIVVVVSTLLDELSVDITVVLLVCFFFFRLRFEFRGQKGKNPEVPPVLESISRVRGHKKKRRQAARIIKSVIATSSVASATTAVVVSAVLGAVVVVVVGGSYETTGARGAPYPVP